ncbi:MAG: alpha/beta fold hydrolase [Angustibacter sp.]
MVDLTTPEVVRYRPASHCGTGVLVLGGSSGRIDAARARLLCEHGALAESIRWFGGPGQQPGPFEVPLETFQQRVDDLARECDRVVLVGTSFGAEAALATASVTPVVVAVAAFAPSDVVWAGVTPDGRQTSHWSLRGRPLPFVPFDEAAEPDGDPPSFVPVYEASRRAAPEAVTAAAIAVERIPEVLCVAGGDDRVWPSVDHAEAIRSRRTAAGRPTILVVDAEAGHRAVLPGEPVVTAGRRMARGGTEDADRRLGAAALPSLLGLLSGPAGAAPARTPGPAPAS